MIADLVRRTRTVRRFQEKRTLDPVLLQGLIDLTRLGGSARNGQVRKYRVISDARLRQEIFPLLGWASYLTDWPGPAPGERPAAFIDCLLDKKLLKGVESEAYCDLGIATQNLLLGTVECGVFGCRRIGAFAPTAMYKLLRLDGRFKALLVVALGFPAETVVLEELGPKSGIRYWRDAQGMHHVPKRSREQILIEPPEGLCLQ